MGSLDPLPARFEIWFESLNFKATWNGYLMRLTNRDKLHPWRSTPDAMPATDAPTPAHAAVASAVGAQASDRVSRIWSVVGPKTRCGTK
jgi:hypothetical protein